jgi:Flp pilus assembly protein TadG
MRPAAGSPRVDKGRAQVRHRTLGRVPAPYSAGVDVWEFKSMACEKPLNRISKATRPAGRGMRAGRASQRGTSSVELALILPIFLFVLFGLIELSVALYDKAVLTQASREGARAGIVLRQPKLSVAEIQQVVLNYTRGSLISLGTSKDPVVTVTQSTPATYPNPLSVKVDYTYTGLGLGALMSAVTDPVVLSATTAMINE